VRAQCEQIPFPETGQCGYDGNPCCKGSQVGDTCLPTPVPQFCGGFGPGNFKAFCIAPGPSDPAGTPVCQACGASNFPCCPDTKAGTVGSCDAGGHYPALAVCVAAADGGSDVCKTCGGDNEPCCNVSVRLASAAPGGVLWSCTLRCCGSERLMPLAQQAGLPMVMP
jgi:hypothetical protein